MSPRDPRTLEFRECVRDEVTLQVPDGGVVTQFPGMTKLKRGETVIFSWIMFKSRAHRDRVNARVKKDPRLAKRMDPDGMPFDVKRMAYDGFEVLVEL